MSPEQAEGFADAIAEAIQSDLSTKADVAAARDDMQDHVADLRREIKESTTTLRSEIKETELRLEAEIEATKADLVKWMFGTIGFQTRVILGAVMTLAR